MNDKFYNMENSCEKLSIRESARTLKKYGSTSSKNLTRNENFIRHLVTETDTLQGIALKYDVTIEKIRRANKLWASDSLFLKEFLLIPVPEGTISSLDSVTTTPLVSPDSNHMNLHTNDDFSDENITEFLGKIDASIANTKEEVRKTQNNSKIITSIDSVTERQRHMSTRVNNNGSVDSYSTPQTVVVQQGRKVKSSIQRHEKQQDEIFEL